MLTPITQDRWSRRVADHLYHRAGFGGSPEEREEFFQLGKRNGIEAAVDFLVEPRETWESHPIPEWSTETDPNGDLWEGDSAKRRSFVAWYMRMLREGQPLAAKLLKFLLDHAPVDMSTCSSETRFMYFIRYFIMLRRHAAGDIQGNGEDGEFKKLIREISWSEAMIKMLDLDKSSANEINENFGRELLELFTMGVNGGYTEADVGAAAEAFTGRRLYRMQSPHPEAHQQNPEYLAPSGEPMASAFQNRERQDLLPKSFLGHDRMPDGRTISSGDDIIELIFENRASARHLAWKLWRYFAAPNPSEELIEALAQKLQVEYDYRIRPLIRDIFLSEEFYSDDCIGQQIKDAGDYLICLGKQFEASPLPDRPIENLNNQLNYNIAYPPNIAGWPEPVATGNEWMSAGALLLRVNAPGIWTEQSYELFNDWGSRRDMDDYAEPDWDAIAPPELRSLDNFPILLGRLSDRFLPLCPLRKSQIRILYDQYAKTSQRVDSLFAVKEAVRLMTALPEYQMQ